MNPITDDEEETSILISLLWPDDNEIWINAKTNKAMELAIEGKQTYQQNKWYPKNIMNILMYLMKKKQTDIPNHALGIIKSKRRKDLSQSLSLTTTLHPPNKLNW